MSPVQLRFHLDPETGEPHVYEHDVDEEEVEDILRDPGEDRKGSGNSHVAIGQTRDGRYLRVIYVRDPVPQSYFVVTAYEIDGKPLAAFKRRQRRRQRR
ncbi:MAG: hypothetical protein ACREQZ_04215 [Woeseiaceae bacterium]